MDVLSELRERQAIAARRGSASLTGEDLKRYADEVERLAAGLAAIKAEVVRQGDAICEMGRLALEELAGDPDRPDVRAMEAMFALSEAVDGGKLTLRDLEEVVFRAVADGHDMLTIVLVMATKAVGLAKARKLRESS